MEEGDKIPPSPAGFSRMLWRAGARTLISSHCQYCGYHIIGSVPTIADEELEHRKGCLHFLDYKAEETDMRVTTVTTVTANREAK